MTKNTTSKLTTNKYDYDCSFLQSEQPKDVYENNPLYQYNALPGHYKNRNIGGGDSKNKTRNKYSNGSCRMSKDTFTRKCILSNTLGCNSINCTYNNQFKEINEAPKNYFDEYLCQIHKNQKYHGNGNYNNNRNAEMYFSQNNQDSENSISDLYACESTSNNELCISLDDDSKGEIPNNNIIFRKVKAYEIHDEISNISSNSTDSIARYNRINADFNSSNNYDSSKTVLSTERENCESDIEEDTSSSDMSVESSNNEYSDLMFEDNDWKTKNNVKHIDYSLFRNSTISQSDEALNYDHYAISSTRRSGDFLKHSDRNQRKPKISYGEFNFNNSNNKQSSHPSRVSINLNSNTNAENSEEDVDIAGSVYHEKNASYSLRNEQQNYKQQKRTYRQHRSHSRSSQRKRNRIRESQKAKQHMRESYKEILKHNKAVMRIKYIIRRAKSSAAEQRSFNKSHNCNNCSSAQTHCNEKACIPTTAIPFQYTTPTVICEIKKIVENAENEVMPISNSGTIEKEDLSYRKQNDNETKTRLVVISKLPIPETKIVEITSKTSLKEKSLKEEDMHHKTIYENISNNSNDKLTNTVINTNNNNMISIQSGEMNRNNRFLENSAVEDTCLFTDCDVAMCGLNESNYIDSQSRNTIATNTSNTSLFKFLFSKNKHLSTCNIDTQTSSINRKSSMNNIISLCRNKFRKTDTNIVDKEYDRIGTDEIYKLKDDTTKTFLLNESNNYHDRDKNRITNKVNDNYILNKTPNKQDKNYHNYNISNHYSLDASVDKLDEVVKHYTVIESDNQERYEQVNVPDTILLKESKKIHDKVEMSKLYSNRSKNMTIITKPIRKFNRKRSKTSHIAKNNLTYNKYRKETPTSNNYNEIQFIPKSLHQNKEIKQNKKSSLKKTKTMQNISRKSQQNICKNCKYHLDDCHCTCAQQ